jgi:general secretion pathway protein G
MCAMPSFFSTCRRSHAGFTLIEIMVVVVIIGILASIVTMNLGGKTEEAKRKATMATIQSIRLGIAEYEMDRGKFPESLGDLVNGEVHYLDQESVPVDAWGNEFRYNLKGDLVKVRSAGTDGVFDTEDDIETPGQEDRRSNRRVYPKITSPLPTGGRRAQVVVSCRAVR